VKAACSDAEIDISKDQSRPLPRSPQSPPQRGELAFASERERAEFIGGTLDLADMGVVVGVLRARLLLEMRPELRRPVLAG